MGRMIAVVLAFMAIVATGVAEAGPALDRARARGHLIAAAVPDFPPQAFVNAKGKLDGFEIAAAEAIGKQMGLAVVFVSTDWNSVLAGNWQGRFDYSLSSITPTPEREARLDFPAVYRFDAAQLAVNKANTAITSPKAASGKAIGVKQGTTFEAFLRRDLVLYKGEKPFTYEIDNPRIRLYPDNEDVLTALAKGDSVEIQAGILSFARIQAAMERGMPIRAVPGFLFFEPIAVAIDKGDAELGAAIADAVAKLKADGTLAALSIKWFGIDLSK
jgi:polar amino acid transport system substrate-binding protein